ncbi:MAG: polysaccharide biosynthesis/export family protein [Pseudomonadota bacterium]
MWNVRSLSLTAVVLFLAAGCAARSSPVAKPEAEKEAPPETTAIGPDDVLQVDVWRHPELSKEVTVRPDGFISLPLVKDVATNGLSATSLAQVLREKFTEFVDDPEVTVIAKAVNSYKVYVLGKVTTSGMFTAKSPVSVVQVIAMAGGFTPFAKTSRVVVLRRSQGKDIRIVVDYDDIVRGRHPERNVMLKPGDTVIVP